MERRNGRALLVVDVAVPRDVDPGVGDVFGVTLLDIDDLRAQGEQSLQQRRHRARRGPRDHHGRARPLPLRAFGSRSRADRHRAAGACRGAARRRARAAFGEAQRPRPRCTNRPRVDHPGPRQQAPARSDRPPEGRRRLGARRALRRRAVRALRARPARRAADRRLMAGRPPLRVATRGSALARLADGSRRRRASGCPSRSSSSRPPATVGPTSRSTRSAAPASSSRRSRTPSSRGDADLAVHSAKDLPSQTARRARARAPCPSVPTRATRWSDPRSPRCPRARGSRPARCGAGPSSPTCAPTSRSPSCAATSAPASRRPEASTPSSSRRPPSTGSVPPSGSGSGSSRRCCCRRSRRARSRSSAVPTTSTRSRSSRPSTTRCARAEVDAERAFLEQLGGGCNLPCGALATRAMRGRWNDGHARDRGSARVARRASRHPRPRHRRRPRRPSGARSRPRLLDEYGGRALLEDVA